MGKGRCVVSEVNEAGLVEVPFTEAVPNLSWYRFQGWPKGSYKRFKNAHTMCSNLDGFTFYTEPNVGIRMGMRGACEKCNTKTNWATHVSGRWAYWCGCS